jgi:hypothetical protein
MNVINKPWTLLADRFPFAVNSSAGIVVGDRIFVIGGAFGSSSVADKRIYSARVFTDGTLSSWTRAGDLLLATSFHKAVYHEPSQSVFVYGGGPTNPKIYKAKVSDDQIGPFTAVEQFQSAANPNPNMVVHGDWIYIVSGTPIRVDSYKVDSDGVVPQSLPPLADPRSAAALFIWGGYLYLVGGANLTSPLDGSEVFSARLEPNGGLGPWKQVGNLPGKRGRLGHAVVGNQVVVIGGRTGGTTSTNTIYSATLMPEGQIGAFATEDAFPIIVRNITNQVFVVGKRIIVVGGFDTANRATVYVSETI